MKQLKLLTLTFFSAAGIFGGLILPTLCLFTNAGCHTNNGTQFAVGIAGLVGGIAIALRRSWLRQS